MNRKDYADLADHTASWANSIRLGNAEIVAETLERVSAYCTMQAGIPDEWVREECTAKDAEQEKSSMICPAPTWKWLVGFFGRGKQPIV